MLYTTRGIVFHQTRYSESSLIVKIFTETLGLQSFMVKGVRSKRSKTKAALFQPLTLLNLVVDRREGKSLHYIRDITLDFNYHSVHTDLNKRAVIIFLADLLYRSIREETPNTTLFNWLYHTLTWYDLNDQETLNFHLLFMLQLSRFLGFYPRQHPGLRNDYFDLQEGEFTDSKPEHPAYFGSEMTAYIVKLQNLSFENSGELKLSNKNRRLILDGLLAYYRLHLPGFGELKSVEVLKSIFE